jgi:hypothetical protein
MIERLAEPAVGFGLYSASRAGSRLGRLRSGPFEGPATEKPPALPEDVYSHPGRVSVIHFFARTVARIRPVCQPGLGSTVIAVACHPLNRLGRQITVPVDAVRVGLLVIEMAPDGAVPRRGRVFLVWDTVDFADEPHAVATLQ